MGCGGSKESSAVAPEKSIAQDWKQVHSMCRWNKELDKLRRTFEQNEEALHYVDPKTLNTPLHISSQNGHEELTQLLIDCKANVDSQNAKGQTPLHMAMSYDYWNVVRMLLDAGASKDLKNEDGIPAIKGLDGDKALALVHFVGSEDREDIETSLNEIEENLAEIDRVEYIKAGLGLKKRFEMTEPIIWGDEEQARFKEVLMKLTNLEHSK